MSFWLVIFGVGFPKKHLLTCLFFVLDEVATLRLFPNIAGWKIPPFYVGNTILLVTNAGGLSRQKSANHQVSIWLKFEIYRGLLMVEKTYKRRFLKTMTHPCHAVYQSVFVSDVH